MPKHKYFDPRRLAGLGRISLVAREVVDGVRTGLHKSLYHGSSVEFAEHREYVQGDNIRNIDWRLFGRTDRHYVKLFENETNLKCYLLVDKSASMAYKGGKVESKEEKGKKEAEPLTKLEYASFLAASLAYLMIHQQDAVGLVTFDDKITSMLAPSSRASHLHLIFERLEATVAGQGTDAARTFHDLAASIKRRSLIVIFSDLMDDRPALMKALHHFRHKKHGVILFHVLDHAERAFPFRRLADFVDMETGERMQVDPLSLRKAYLEEMGKFTSELKRDCSESRIEYVPVDTSEPFDRVLMGFLARRAKY
jgi:uncharacterized protein (DUF58 family)